jgi:type VI protein secretion system component Hcp
MAEDSRDILMKIVGGAGPIDAECQAVIASGDTLASGFVSNMPATGGTTRPNYFAIEDFTFEVALSGDTTDAKAANAQKELAKSIEEKLGKSKEFAGLDLGTAKDSSEFKRFMSNGRGALRVKTYPADLEAIKITKELDASSLTLLQGCLTSVVFKNATLIKRRATGLTTAGNSGVTAAPSATSDLMLQSFMRIDFTDLLITDFNWEEDDVIKETFKFICRSATVQYSVQEASGKLIKPGTGKWSVLNLGGSTVS